MNVLEDERNPVTAERPSGNVFWLFGQMFFIPFRTFMYGIEMMLEGMLGFPRARQNEISNGAQQLMSQLGATRQAQAHPQLHLYLTAAHEIQAANGT